jgi:hypothetical protein
VFDGHDLMLQTSFKMEAFDENVGVISASLKPAGKFQMRLIQTGIDRTLQAKGNPDTHSSDHNPRQFRTPTQYQTVHAGHPLFS